jgi:hypothetical protein
MYAMKKEKVYAPATNDATELQHIGARANAPGSKRKNANESLLQGDKHATTRRKNNI